MGVSLRRRRPCHTLSFGTAGTDLDDLMENVPAGSGIYSELGQSIRVAFGKGKLKHVKYIRKLEKHSSKRQILTAVTLQSE